jgi:RecA-family ATPase
MGTDMEELIKYCNERREIDRREIDQNHHDLRERIIRVEQDIVNHKDSFKAFKTEEFAALKNEVHSMRLSMDKKFDEVLVHITGIRLNLAKWVGAAGAILFICDLAVKVIFKV